MEANPFALPVERQGDWYESHLSVAERKRRGHFSTPLPLIEHILEACHFSPTADLTTLRVLDPACGSGNFLVALCQRFLASGLSYGYGAEALLEALQKQLWGFDADPAACTLAEMQVRHTIARMLPQADLRNLSLHIHQADSLCLPWPDTAQVDLFVANPPYLAAKNGNLHGYRFAREHGQNDFYLLFIELALKIVRPDGWLALVLPDPLLVRHNARFARKQLLAETSLSELWHIAGVFPAYVGAVVILAQRRSAPPGHTFLWQRGRWQHEEIYPDTEMVERSHRLSQSFLDRQPGSVFRYLLNEEPSSLVEHLHSYWREGEEKQAVGLQPLSHFVEIRRGEEIGKDDVRLWQTPPSPRGWLPVLRGGVDLQPYVEPQATYWLHRSAIHKNLTRYKCAKLFVVKSSATLQATLDRGGHVALQTLYLLVPGAKRKLTTREERDELYFLMALLNSRLLQDYLIFLYTAYKLVQPQIEQHVLARLPIPELMNPLREQIIKRARLLMKTCTAGASSVEWEKRYSLYTLQEQAIRALYAQAIGLDQHSFSG